MVKNKTTDTEVFRIKVGKEDGEQVFYQSMKENLFEFKSPNGKTIATFDTSNNKLQFEKNKELGDAYFGQIYNISDFSANYAMDLTFTLDVDGEPKKFTIGANGITEINTKTKMRTKVFESTTPLNVVCPYNFDQIIIDESIKMTSFPPAFKIFDNENGEYSRPVSIGTDASTNKETKYFAIGKKIFVQLNSGFKELKGLHVDASNNDTYDVVFNIGGEENRGYRLTLKPNKEFFDNFYELYKTAHPNEKIDAKSIDRITKGNHTEDYRTKNLTKQTIKLETPSNGISPAPNPKEDDEPNNGNPTKQDDQTSGLSININIVNQLSAELIALIKTIKDPDSKKDYTSIIESITALSKSFETKMGGISDKLDEILKLDKGSSQDIITSITNNLTTVINNQSSSTQKSFTDLTLLLNQMATNITTSISTLNTQVTNINNLNGNSGNNAEELKAIKDAIDKNGKKLKTLTESQEKITSSLESITTVTKNLSKAVENFPNTISNALDENERKRDIKNNVEKIVDKQKQLLSATKKIFFAHLSTTLKLAQNSKEENDKSSKEFEGKINELIDLLNRVEDITSLRPRITDMYCYAVKNFSGYYDAPLESIIEKMDRIINTYESVKNITPTNETEIIQNNATINNANKEMRQTQDYKKNILHATSLAKTNILKEYMSFLEKTLSLSQKDILKLAYINGDPSSERLEIPDIHERVKAMFQSDSERFKNIVNEKWNEDYKAITSKWKAQSALFSDANRIMSDWNDLEMTDDDIKSYNELLNSILPEKNHDLSFDSLDLFGIQPEKNNDPKNDDAENNDPKNDDAENNDPKNDDAENNNPKTGPDGEGGNKDKSNQSAIDDVPIDDANIMPAKPDIPGKTAPQRKGSVSAGLITGFALMLAGLLTGGWGLLFVTIGLMITTSSAIANSEAKKVVDNDKLTRADNPKNKRKHFSNIKCTTLEAMASTLDSKMLDISVFEIVPPYDQICDSLNKANPEKFKTLMETGKKEYLDGKNTKEAYIYGALKNKQLIEAFNNESQKSGRFTKEELANYSQLFADLGMDKTACTNRTKMLAEIVRRNDLIDEKLVETYKTVIEADETLQETFAPKKQNLATKQISQADKTEFQNKELEKKVISYKSPDHIP